MTRGFVWGYYHSDDGNTYALQVDADYAGMSERGWVTPAASGTIVFPRGWTPRRVIGLDDRGKLQVAVVASVTADLWTGAATTFTINGSDELPHTVNVTLRKAERNQVKP
jgi:hypothetical protein